MIPEGMRDVLPPERGRLRAVEDRAARPLRRLRLRRGAHAVAGVRRDPRGRRRRHARGGLPPARRAGPRAHGPHRHDGAGGAHGRRPLRRRPAAAALQLRGPEHPPLGAAAGPGRRVPAGRRGAARAATRPRPTPSASTLLCDALAGLGLPRLHASRSARPRSSARSSTRSGSADEDREKFNEALGRPRLPAASRASPATPTWRRGAQRRCSASSS